MRSAIVSIALGVLLLQQQAALPAILTGCLLSALATLILSVSCHQTGRLARLASILSCALLGYCGAAWMAHGRLSDGLPEAWESKEIQLTGVVASLPQRFERGERFEFDVETVHNPSAHVPRHIQLSWYHSWDDQNEADDDSAVIRAVHPGERWRLTVSLKRPHGNANPHGFDYEAWLLERNIRATGSIRSRAGMQRLERFVWRPSYAVERLREAIRARFLTALPEAPYLGVLIALAVGDQWSIPNAQWQVFNRTGVTHLVSISGLHVTMIAALFAAAINELWRRSTRLMHRLPAQKAAIVAGWAAALVYALLAGFEVPAQRTLYMLSVVALSLWSGRHLGVSRTLLLALFVVLLLDPWAVLATGFWLSFGAVAILFLVGSARVGEALGWRVALARWGATQWAVTVASLPLLLLFFQQFSLVSPLANALAIPVISFIVTPLALLFTLIPWTPLLYADHQLLSWLMHFLEWLSAMPVWQQPAPPAWAVAVALVGVVWLLLPRGFPARWLGLCLLLPAVFWRPPVPPAGAAWVDVLDVGQGMVVVVRTAEHSLLYDSGPLYSAEANAGQRVVLPYLRAIGVGQIDAMVISHRDKDHAGGLSSIQAGMPIGRLLSSIPELNGEPCRAGQQWTWDGVRFLVLHPAATDYADPAKKPNNLSCVLRVESASGSLLLPADIEADDEHALLARSPSLLRSTVLLVPHHGGKGSSTPEFVAAVAPREVVFSAGYRNAFGHPRAEVLERYADRRTWRTDRQGAIRVELSDAVTVSAWRETRPRYWQGR